MIIGLVIYKGYMAYKWIVEALDQDIHLLRAEEYKKTESTRAHKAIVKAKKIWDVVVLMKKVVLLENDDPRVKKIFSKLRIHIKTRMSNAQSLSREASAVKGEVVADPEKAAGGANVPATPKVQAVEEEVPKEKKKKTRWLSFFFWKSFLLGCFLIVDVVTDLVNMSTIQSRACDFDIFDDPELPSIRIHFYGTIQDTTAFQEYYLNLRHCRDLTCLTGPDGKVRCSNLGFIDTPVPQSNCTETQALTSQVHAQTALSAMTCIVHRGMCRTLTFCINT